MNDSLGLQINASFPFRVEKMMVVAGDYSLTIYEGTEQEVLPQFLLPHPQYNYQTNNYDIMLIKVQMHTICLLYFYSNWF